MQVPLEISCPNFAKTDAIDALVRAEADKLERICGYIVSCRVAVERAHRHQHTDNPYRVRIDVRVPHNREIVVKRESLGAAVHEDLDALVRESFDVMERRLKKLVEKQHGMTKAHPTHEVTAFVAKWFPEEEYGFLETLDGRQVYFHRNSIANGGMSRLAIGAGVRFVEESGDQGPQATTVQVLEKVPGAVPGN